MSNDRWADEIGREHPIMIHGHLGEANGGGGPMSPMGRRRHMLGPPGSLNTITPCAACKLLRRRCAEECPFSPYFSPHEPQKFAAVHKVFGASNVAKMLMEVPDSQRADAANSLVYEANLRIRDPVYGCMGAISTLQHQIQTLQVEVDAVRTEILRYKYREARINPNTIHHPHANNMANGMGSLVISSPTTLSCSSTDTMVVAATQPQAPLPPPPCSRVMSSNSSTSSSTSSIYTTTTTATATAYSSIASDHNVSYFE